MRADLDVRETLRCKQSILNLETPKKQGAGNESDTFFFYLLTAATEVFGFYVIDMLWFANDLS